MTLKDLRSRGIVVVKDNLQLRIRRTNNSENGRYKRLEHCGG